MIKLAICDDDLNILNQIDNYFEKINNQGIEYEIFFSAEELSKFCNLEKSEFDVYILDIEMKKMSGLELAKKIRKYDLEAIIIFMTSHREYVFDVFEVLTFDYIVKPIDIKKFQQIIDKVKNYLHIVKNNFVFSYKKNNYSIPFSKINYIEKNGRKAIIHTVTNEIYQCNMTCNEMMEALDSELFANTRKSCIVNLKEIYIIDGEKVTLKNGEILYIGREYKKQLKKRHFDLLRGMV